ALDGIARSRDGGGFPAGLRKTGAIGRAASRATRRDPGAAGRCRPPHWRGLAGTRWPCRRTTASDRAREPWYGSGACHHRRADGLPQKVAALARDDRRTTRSVAAGLHNNRCEWPTEKQDASWRFSAMCDFIIAEGGASERERTCEAVRCHESRLSVAIKV